MSKLDAQRAMREAKYENDRARARALSSTPRAPGAPVRTTPAPPKVTASPAAPASSEETCGHRSMNGRTCTREQGHSEKSHRYS